MGGTSGAKGASRDRAAGRGSLNSRSSPTEAPSRSASSRLSTTERPSDGRAASPGSRKANASSVPRICTPPVAAEPSARDAVPVSWTTASTGTVSSRRRSSAS